MMFWQRRIDGLSAFYMSGLLRAIYASMTSIFVPIFLYKISGSLYTIALYYIVQRLIIVFLSIPISKIIENLGYRVSIAISIVLLIGNTLSLYMAQKEIYFLIVAVILEGLQVPMYWISRDSALSQDIEDKQVGSEMAKLFTLEKIAGLLGPITGGAIIYFLGYKMLFFVAIILLLISLIPLFHMRGHTHKNGVSLKGFYYFVMDLRYRHIAVSNFAISIHNYGRIVIWPMLLFVQGIENVRLGGIYSAAILVGIIVTYLAGDWFDLLRKRAGYFDEGVYGIAGIFVSFIWLFRYFVRGITQILPLDMFGMIFESIYSSFYSDYLHLGGKRYGSIAYWVYIEMTSSFGAILLFATMAIGIYFNIWKEFVVGTVALWSIASIKIARESNL